MHYNDLRSGILALFLTVGLVACGPGNNGQQGQSINVGVVTVRPSAVPLTTELSGRTSAYQVSEVRPQVGGIITKRLFIEGGTVKAGQPLYQIDPATYRAAFDSARATAAAALAKAQRYRQLNAANAISKQDYDNAQAEGLAARAQLDMARINLTYTRVLSPISGHVGKSTVTVGALVTANQTNALTTVQQLDPIYVDVTQSVSDLLRLKRDMAAGQVGRPTTANVELVLEDGTVYPLAGKLEFSDVTVDPGTGTIGLRAIFPNPDGVLLPGMYVRARIAKGVASKGLLVPQQAVSRDPKGNATVYVVGKGDTAEMRVITTAQTVGDKWLVTDGLKPGDKVIVEGLQMLRPGAPVKASELESPKGNKG